MSPLKPIRTNKDHAEAMKEIDRLLALDPKPKSAEADRLDVLTILVEAFESRHPDHRIDSKVDPVAAIEFHLDRQGKTTKDLETILQCSRPRVWEIMNRKRPLTLAQIRLLVNALGIPADRLIGEYDLAQAAPAADNVRSVRHPLKRAAATRPRAHRRAEV
jgi:HTH-type transcriptional regulator / antitoxin HigA